MTPAKMIELLNRVHELEAEKNSLGFEQIARFDACLNEIALIRREFSEIGFFLFIDNGMPMLMVKRHE